MLKKTITQLSILTIVIGSIFLANGLILAWTSPGYNPPDGNVDAPLNIGSDSQYKLGALGVEGIFRGYSNAIFDGNVISAEPTISSHLTTKKYVDERITTQFECTSGAVSKINLLTGAVECRDVAGVTSPDYLVYNQHTQSACTSLGGVVVSDGTNSFCKFLQGSCPSGWANYGSWSKTSANTCGVNWVCTSGCYWADCNYFTINGDITGQSSKFILTSPVCHYGYYNTYTWFQWCGCGVNCNTQGHSFSNNAVETCTFVDGSCNQSGGEDPFFTPYCVSTPKTCTATRTETGCY